MSLITGLSFRGAVIRNISLPFELKIDGVDDNRLSFPKDPCKIRLPPSIIDIIALKDRQCWPKTTKTTFKIESKRNVFFT